ncbi:MAG: hypothetical protein ABSG53_33785, partial [Thermoguttaceae bacterium]
IDDKLRSNDHQLPTALTSHLTEEQKQKLATLSKEIDGITSQLAECEKTLGVRQVAWERKLREEPQHLPSSLKKGLILHYPFSEAEGNAIANAVKGQPPGTYKGIEKPQWLPGVVGQALRLDGKQEGVDCGDMIQVDRTDAISYGAWIYAQRNDDRGCLVGKFADEAQSGFSITIDAAFLTVNLFRCRFGRTASQKAFGIRGLCKLAGEAISSSFVA